MNPVVIRRRGRRGDTENSSRPFSPRLPFSLSPRLLLVLLTGVVLLYGVIYPNLHVVVASLQRDANWSLANYRQALSQTIVLESIFASVGISVLTVLFCAAAGIPLAFLFERYTFPARRLFATFAALPLVLPPLVGTVAFIFLCGESGILARLAQSVFHLENSPWSLRGWPALLLFHTYTMYPFFYILTGAGLTRIDAALAEAGRSLGASRTRVLTRIVLPQLTPSLIAAALLTFMTSMASFSAPLLFGGGVRVLTLEIYAARQRGDASLAITETVILAAISLSALFFFQRYEGTRRFAAAAMKGSTKQRRAIATGKSRSIAIACGVLFSVLLVLPVATLVLVSFAREGNWTTQTLPTSYTIANYVKIFSDSRASEVFLNSLSMSAIAAGAALVWSFCVAGSSGEKRKPQMEAAAFVVDTGALGAAGNRGCRFTGRSLRTTIALAGFFYSRRHVLDSAGGLLPALHAAGCARRARRAWNRLMPRWRKRRRVWARALVAAVHSCYLAAGLARGNRRDSAGFCDCAGRICGFGAGVCPDQSANLNRHCVRAARFQSGNSSRLWCCPDGGDWINYDARNAFGTFARLTEHLFPAQCGKALPYR